MIVFWQLITLLSFMTMLDWQIGGIHYLKSECSEIMKMKAATLEITIMDLFCEGSDN